MIRLLSWLIYGLIVGVLAKTFYGAKNTPSGWISTLLIGVSGSFVGGFINYLLGYGDNMFQASGIVMGILGGILALYLHKKFVLDKKDAI